MRKKKPRTGSRVLLDVKISEATSMLEPFIGHIYTVASCGRLKEHPVYTLEGVESDFGIPYTISHEWLEVIEW